MLDATKAQLKRADRIKKRIASFSKIEPNWDSYGGKAITKTAIKRATKLVDEIDPFCWEKVEAFPTSIGGVQFEFFYRTTITIDVLPNGSLDIDMDDDEEPYVEV